MIVLQAQGPGEVLARLDREEALDEAKFVACGIAGGESAAAPAASGNRVDAAVEGAGGNVGHNSYAACHASVGYELTGSTADVLSKRPGLWNVVGVHQVNPDDLLPLF